MLRRSESTTSHLDRLTDSGVSRWTALAMIAAAELLVLSVWISASAVSLPLAREWHLDSLQVALLTSSVQVGFVFGALVSAALALADRLHARNLFAIAALSAALLTALFAMQSNFVLGTVLRFGTGIALAGVYPVAVKLIAAWFPTGRGVAVGVLIAALTLGSALPHLFVSFASVSWHGVMYLSAVLAIMGSCIVLFLLPDAPRQASVGAPKLSWSALKQVIANRPIMLANIGYGGHMWELYAMWTWFPAFLTASIASREPNGALVSALGSFAVIGIAGAAGCVAAGYMADRWGRTTTTSVALAISGTCAVAIGLTFRASPLLSLVIGFVWGASIVADSAQFSAAVTELSDPEMTGTALTFQMAIGFSITFISINVIPAVVAHFGWAWAFVTLAPGPIFGIIAMQMLRRDASAVRMANGQR
jgi:MFS family permease